MARPFLFGATPSSADASVAATLGGMRASPVETLQSKRVARDEALMAYIARMEAALPIKSPGTGAKADIASLHTPPALAAANDTAEDAARDAQRVAAH